jgi:hypothetical protein
MTAEHTSVRWGGGVPVPLDLAPPERRASYLAMLSHDEFVRQVDQAPIVSMPIDSIHATQPTVDGDVVESMVEDPPTPGTGRKNDFGLLTDYPLVVRFDGEDLLHDGHHRIAAAVERDEDEAQVRLLDLDEVRGRTLLAMHAQLTQQGDAA